MAALTAALLAMTAASTAQGFMANRQAGKIGRAQGKYEGQLADMNAALADVQATDALARGDEAAGRSRLGTTQLLGGQRAALGASGVVINDGSAAQVQAEARFYGALDEITIRNNARREAWGFKAQAINDRAQGRMSRAAGRNIGKASDLASYSSLLTGAAQAGSIYRGSK